MKFFIITTVNRQIQKLLPVDRFCSAPINSPARKRSVPLFGKDDCMDAGGRASMEQLPEGLGEILFINSLRSFFFAAEVNLTPPGLVDKPLASGSPQRYSERPHHSSAGQKSPRCHPCAQRTSFLTVY